MNKIETCMVPQWALCEKCNGAVENKVEMSIGDKVNFTKVTSSRGSFSFSAVSGKIDEIGPEKVAIMYRKKRSVHKISDISHPMSKTGLTIAMSDPCGCCNE